MSKTISFEYECTRQTFRSWPNASVRWLDWEQDYVPAQCMWPHSAPLTREAWQEARAAYFTYCAAIADQEILSMAAVWKYCETAWEVAAVGTRPPFRRRGYGKGVVSFVTAYILAAERLATCSTAGDNLAMQRTAESVGFYLVRRSLVDVIGAPGSP